MRDVSGPIAAALESSVTSLSRLVDVKLTSGKTFYFTDSDRDVAYGGNVYSSQYGCGVSQVRGTLGTDAESVTVTVLMNPDAISSALVEGGALDAAAVRVLLVDHSNTASAAVIFVGNVSELDFVDGLTVEISAKPLLSQERTLAADVYCSNCRADFGDAKCKYPITYETQTVSSVPSAQAVITTQGDPDHTFQAGLLVFQGGANDGMSFEIADSLSDGTVQLRGLMPTMPAVGDTVRLYLGCDKTPTMCSERWNNIANFRGEPFAVAPWIVTSQAQDNDQGNTDGGDYSTAPPQRTLFLYWGVLAFFNSYGQWYGELGSDDPTFPDNPEWGPVQDDWGFGGYDANGNPVSYRDDVNNLQIYRGSPALRVCIASEIKQGINRGDSELAGHYYEDVKNIYHSRQLTDAEAAKVRQKYPNA